MLLMRKLRFKETCLRPWGHGLEARCSHSLWCWEEGSSSIRLKELSPIKHSSRPAGEGLSQAPADFPTVLVGWFWA